MALAAGFGSLRRFNALFQNRYGLAPTELRRASAPATIGDGLRFELAFRPPFDWPRLLRFLAGRCVAGAEEVTDGSYRRSVRIEAAGTVHAGWLSLTLSEGREAIAASVSPSLVRALPAVLAGVRRVCDLTCEPDAVAQALGSLAADAPGLRVPGAFDGFEMAVRAVLGQQVTVKAAHTLAGRFTAALGDAIETPFAAISRVFPTPQRVTQASIEDIAAQYIALRALAWPDAWPSGDVALLKSLGVTNAREADALAEAWRPWRGYATLHLWRRLSESTAMKGVKQ